MRANKSQTATNVSGIVNNENKKISRKNNDVHKFNKSYTDYKSFDLELRRRKITKTNCSYLY